MRPLLLLSFLFLALPARADEMNACEKNRDCVVVFDFWCLTPQAINQDRLPEWIKQQQEAKDRAKEERHTCKAYSDTNLHYAFCEQKQCRFGVKEAP